MVCVILFFAIVILDQVSKAIVDMNNLHIPVIKNVFHISNIRNSGAAFGMMSDEPFAMAIFITLTIVSMIAISLYLIFKKNDSKWLDISLAFIAGGAIGNFIDRLAFKEVRDFIDVRFFANFNVADIAVTVGGIMLVVYFFFLDKDAVFKRKPKADADSVDKLPVSADDGLKVNDSQNKAE